MYGLLVSAFNTILGFLLRGVVVKLLVYTALFFVTTEFISYVTQFLPDGSSLTQAFGGLTSDVWYWLDLFQVPFGVSATLSAYVTRFAIRRLPVIG
ncbi:hypothetical protein GALL_429600 [mine drainage metagenome]|uniref:DUF2523 domain-containing protein n=1 Tax=mine drainage metagenome TaxID=410659 RepID=A0A1J5Q652_9ZZZZ